MNPATMPDARPIMDLANAFLGSCVLFAASDAGVFRRLSEQDGLDAPALASDLGMSKRGMRLLLDACVAEGLLTKSGDRYSNSQLSRIFLTPGSPGDLSAALRYNRDIYSAWGKLPEFIRSGAPVERPQLHLGDDAARTRTFVLSMHSRALGIGRAVVPLIDLAGRQRLLDVGGGPGTYSVLLTQAFPELRATVLDLPEIVKIAADLISEHGAAEKVGTLPGDYHVTPFPKGVDAINLFGMLHQESPEAIRALAQKAFDALEPGGAIHIMDMMTDETHTEPKFSALFALTMALTTDHGWVFSAGELREWLEGVGFVKFEVRPLPPPLPHWLAKAIKP